jgi:hypothetical protein
MVSSNKVRSEQQVWLERAIDQNPTLAADYKAELGISEISLPKYVSPDTAVYYKPSKDGAYTTVQYPGDTHGLVTAMRKGWLMEAPSKGVENPLEDSRVNGYPGESTPWSDAEQAKIELANALERREERETIKARTYKCSHPGCRRAFNTNAGLTRHMTVKHN